MIRDTVAHLVKHGREVVYDAEHFFDGYKDSPEHALATLEAAAVGGAACLVLCDTNGGTLPSEVMKITQDVKARIPNVAVGIHTHNDCELAVANAIAAVAAGASQVQGTINGYGERTGNCNLTSAIPILQLKMGIPVVPKLEDLRDLSYFVDDVPTTRTSPARRLWAAPPLPTRAACTSMPCKNSPAVTSTSSQAASANSQNILVSELSGQSNILIKAAELGMPLEKGSPVASALLTLVKERENEGYSYESAGGSLELLLRRELGQYAKTFDITEYHTTFRQYRDGHQPVCESIVKLSVDGTAELTVAEGHGVVNALTSRCAKPCCHSIRKSPRFRSSITRCAFSMAMTPPRPKRACSSFPPLAKKPGHRRCFG